MHLIPCEAEVFNIDALGGSTDTTQARRGLRSRGEKGVGQNMVIATGGSKSKARNHAERSNRGEQVEALLPADAIAPTAIG